MQITGYLLQYRLSVKTIYKTSVKLQTNMGELCCQYFYCYFTEIFFTV